MIPECKKCGYKMPAPYTTRCAQCNGAMTKEKPIKYKPISKRSYQEMASMILLGLKPPAPINWEEAVTGKSRAGYEKRRAAYKKRRAQKKEAEAAAALEPEARAAREEACAAPLVIRRPGLS